MQQSLPVLWMPLPKLNIAELRGESRIKWGIKEVSKPCHESFVFKNGLHIHEWVCKWGITRVGPIQSQFVCHMDAALSVSLSSRRHQEGMHQVQPVSLQS